MCIQSFQITGVLFNGNKPQAPRKLDRRFAANPTWNSYKGSDGRWFALGMSNDSFWPAICRVLEKPEWLTDERFKDLRARQANNVEFIRILDDLFAGQPAAHWIKLFTDVNLLATPVNQYHDLRHDPQTKANGYIIEVEREDGAPPIEMVGPPVYFSKTPARVRRLAPEFDQHTEEVLLEAGCTWEEIEQLRRDGVIGARATAPA
jgi:crotonobetainyl-CoA:carnitine CoA-transferase CaiB-like acyl-CoA transferase